MLNGPPSSSCPDQSRPKRQAAGKRLCCPADTIEAARALVEGTTLSLDIIAAQVGVQRETVARMRDRHGWTRPAGARVPGRAGGGHAIGPEVVEAARALVEGTALPQAVIAARLGIGRATLGRWGKARRWTRPPEAPTFLRPCPDGRARPVRYLSIKGRPYAADAVGTAKYLLTETLMSQAAIAKRLGVSSAWVCRQLHRKGLTRPPVPRGNRRFSAFVRTAPVATSGDRRGRPYAPETVAAARELYQASGFSTRLIAARVGVSTVTITRWARKEGWVRPRDLPEAYGCRPRRRRRTGWG